MNREIVAELNASDKLKGRFIRGYKAEGPETKGHQIYILKHLNKEAFMLEAHYLHTAVMSKYYQKQEWQAWADRIILKHSNIEMWIFDVSIAKNEDELYSAICDKMREEFFDEHTMYSEPDVILGYYCLLLKKGCISIAELASRIMDEDDRASEADVLNNTEIIMLSEKIFKGVFNQSDFEKILAFLYPLAEIALEQQQKLEEYNGMS